MHMRINGDTWYILIIRDYDDFLEDLEEDKMYRQNVNIYKGMDSKSYDCIFCMKKVTMKDSDAKMSSILNFSGILRRYVRAQAL